ncbi:MAG: MerR family transcriptional regulator [Lentisphaeraceae bacterium]|nr:MerR family transcriptional regulator [Lentisphaeraceae bacterium]
MVKEFLIPEKKYFSISEVAELCDLKTHTLRFWEKEFKELSPVTRKGNRRYYQREDIVLVMKIKSLLHSDGMTVSGAKKSLNSNTADLKGSDLDSREILQDLEDILQELKK